MLTTVIRKFVTGDKVCLMGDIGPVMVVDENHNPESKYVSCIWFDRHDILQQKNFANQLLDWWCPVPKPAPTKPSSGGQSAQ